MANGKSTGQTLVRQPLSNAIKFGHTPNRSQWFDDYALCVDSEMMFPLIDARIEKTNERLSAWHKRRNIGSLSPIAKCACKRQIIEVSLSAMLFGDDVINLTADKSIILVDQAILASASCAILDFSPKLSANIASHGKDAPAPEPWLVA